MSTKTIPTTPETAARQIDLPNAGKLLLHVGRGLLYLVLVLLALITMLPVGLLFVVTSVSLLPAIMLVLADLGLVAVFFRLERTWKVTGAVLAGFVIVALLAIWLSQAAASTPPISDARGNRIPGSIASLEKVTLGGSEQWITVRGYDQSNPVLMFLAGGPGGSELAMMRKYLGELEKYFVVVNWDQPGTGKSYRAADFDTITPEDYVSDGYELTQYLRERFDQDKIYIFGESWGSILGIWLVQQYPERYHAFVSTGQMVAPVENDIQMYEFALNLRAEQGRMDDVEQLRRNGPPPYDKGELLRKFQAINGPVNSYMEAHAHGEGTGHNLMFDSLRAEEYGLLDKGYWFLGLARTFTTIYPQIYDLDLRTQAARLEVPVYFIKGRWDINASNSLLEEYFAILEAPHKELIWFEDSAHTPSWDEPGYFVDVMVNTVLAQTQSPKASRDTFSGYFDTQIPIYLRNNGIAGAVVAVVQNGEPVLLQGYGYADVAQGVPMDPHQTIVHIGSAGKTFTATAVMQLVEDGLIDLDADVNTYLDFKIPETYPEPVTIRDLLRHTSGFEARDMNVIMLDLDAVPSIRDFLIDNMPTRVRPPGETTGYSNYSLALLGYVIERVTGMPLGDYLEASILTPLDMPHSSAHMQLPESLQDDFATGYRDLEPQPTEYIAAFGAAPIRTTAADMSHYMLAHLQLGRYEDARILQADTARTMQAPQFSADPRLNGTGLGFYEMSCNGQRIIGHLGTTNYFHSVLLLLPEQQLGVFASFNSMEAAELLPTGTLLRDFVDNFFPQEYEPLAPPADFDKRAEDYTGTCFWNNRHSLTKFDKALFLFDAVTISAPENDTLTVTLFGEPRTFIETGPDTFRRTDDDDLLVFHRDEDGHVISASMNSRSVFTLDKRPWYEAPKFTFGIFILTDMVFLSALIMAVANLWRSRGKGLPPMSVLGHCAALLMPVLNLGGLVALVLMVPTIGQGLTASQLRIVLGLPIMGAVLTIALVGTMVNAWAKGHWTLLVRTHYTVVAVAGLLYVAVLNIWNLIGWHI